MTAKKLLLFCVLLLCQVICAQKDSIVDLKEVIVSDVQLKKFSATQSVVVLNDSTITRNASSLTSLLNYNSVVYFKENGLGMVSSPSFRGTTAQQTAVIWNGININSQLNGQTDFNTISTRDFNSISIRAGGGGSLYGTSAIGGTIHLNNDLVFDNQLQNEFFLAYGSFNTFDSNYKLRVGNKKMAAQVSISHNSSDNDYEYFGKNGQRNENGKFSNSSVNVSFGYHLNKQNMLKFYSQFYDSERYFPLYSPTETRTKYKDLNSRNLIILSSTIKSFVSTIKLGFLTESYKYFANISSKSFSFGEVETAIARYDLSYQWRQKMFINAIIDYSKNRGNGTTIPMVEREIYSGSINFNHQVGSRFKYEASIRKEETSSYKSPILFSLGANLSPSAFYSLKGNFSRNYRIPTYNDLYWEDLGNWNLKAESSFQGEISNVFAFRNFNFTTTFYKSEIQDMIRWIPTAGGISRPENTARVGVLGLEAIVNCEKRFDVHLFKLNLTYGYTRSEDQETKKQLTYVPFHKMTAGLAYSYHRFSTTYQYMYNGKVFVFSDNNPHEIVDWYAVSNIDLSYCFHRSSNSNIGCRILNVWNEKYQSIDNRPMPGRNFNLYLTFKF